MQNLPQPLPPPSQQNWTNTVPARSRGRGRGRPNVEKSEPPSNFRSITPDQYSSPNSRSNTPSHEFNR